MRIAQRESEAPFNTLDDEIFISANPQPTDDLYFEITPVDSWRYGYIKRAFDFSIALVLCIIFAIPGCLIAAAVLLTSRGGIFYREQRIGRHGRTFRIWKFRSMYSDRERRLSPALARSSVIAFESRHNKRSNDKRITKVGGFLRRWSLDELPQLLNVLRGEMSLIGPRPIVESEMALYGTRLEYYLKATPGMSGLWQVSGRSLVDYDRRVKLDALYVRSWSLETDLYILFRTIPAVLGRIGAF